MEVRTTGQGWRDHSATIGWTRRVLVVLVATVAGPIRAGEERDAPPAVVNPIRGDGLPRSAVQPAAAARGSGVDRPPPVRLVLKPTLTEAAERAPGRHADLSPIDRAVRAIADSQARYDAVEDYTCTFFKRERIAGRMTPLHVMAMKVRTRPKSVYLKFQRPASGREAIYIAGRHDGKVLAHDVGFNKVLAGTLALDPTSTRAMEDCRHPITEAGIGPLLDTLAKRWALELNPEDSRLVFHDDMLVGSMRCTMIESTHPNRRPAFLHYRVRVFIDQELGLPVRFEAYDWPKSSQSEPELLEEYTYMHLKLNVGLRDIDFDTSNAEYSFGRF
jgi:hypothetical protein